MERMIIVMGNGMATKADGTADRGLFPNIVTADLIPFIESTYNVMTDREHRAMAGLSMGSFHTSITTLTHPELFAWAGLFSGFVRAPWAENAEQPHLKLMEDAEAFNKAFRLFYRAMGTEDQFWESFAKDDEFLAGKGLNLTRETFPGGHDWTVWRRCIRSFLPKLFR